MDVYEINVPRFVKEGCVALGRKKIGGCLACDVLLNHPIGASKVTPFNTARMKKMKKNRIESVYVYNKEVTVYSVHS
jgi:hypothetical protein